jgi:hypothetical protein
MKGRVAGRTRRDAGTPFYYCFAWTSAAPVAEGNTRVPRRSHRDQEGVPTPFPRAPCQTDSLRRDMAVDPHAVE